MKYVKESRNYNIISCHETFTPSFLPGLRKLGDKVDFPSIKNWENKDIKINYSTYKEFGQEGSKQLPSLYQKDNLSSLINSSSVDYNIICSRPNEYPT